MQRLRERGFRSGWEFAAWLGLVPPQNSTGGKNRLGGVSKRGNQYLRPLLINGASANAGHSDANYTEIYALYRNRSERCTFFDRRGDPLPVKALFLSPASAGLFFGSSDEPACKRKPDRHTPSGCHHRLVHAGSDQPGLYR
jgi:hypothetical protein